MNRRPSRPPRKRLVLPLDLPDLESAKRLIEELAPEVGVFKVGLELFTACGPDAVTAVRDAGADCFLDLKLHDIPNTVSRAAQAACRLGVRYLTVHAAAGPRCLSEVAAAVRGGPTQLLAVTILTSLDEDELPAIGLQTSPTEAVMQRSTLAHAAGIDGLVCSPREARALRHALPDALLVVPGIRPSGTAAADQRRTATPAEAISWGADLLVVGRPIVEAHDRVAAAREIVREIEAAAS